MFPVINPGRIRSRSDSIGSPNMLMPKKPGIGLWFNIAKLTSPVKLAPCNKTLSTLTLGVASDTVTEAVATAVPNGFVPVAVIVWVPTARFRSAIVHVSNPVTTKLASPSVTISVPQLVEVPEICHEFARAIVTVGATPSIGAIRVAVAELNGLVPVAVIVYSCSGITVLGRVAVQLSLDPATVRARFPKETSKLLEQLVDVPDTWGQLTDVISTWDTGTSTR